MADPLTCGICTGGVRMYEGTLFGRPIKDWKHTWVPEGTAPHRPVLGVPASDEVLQRIREHNRKALEAKQAATTVKQVGPQLPLESPRPAASHEIPQSVGRMLMIAGAYGWELLGGVTYFQSSDSTRFLIAKFRRRDLGAVGGWRQRPGKQWSFEEGWALAPGAPHQVGSEQLKEWLRQPDEACPDCGRSSIVHAEECETDGN